MDDGFLVVSIDDSELHNLRELLNEVFGEENFVVVLIFDRNRKNDAKLFSAGHEYMVIYAKNKVFLAENNVKLPAQKEGVEELHQEFERLRKVHNDNWVRITEGIRDYCAGFEEDDPRLPLARYTKVDERGPFRTDGDPSWPGGGGPRYEVPHPTTNRPCKVPSRGWVWPTYDRMKEEIDKGNVVFGPDETTIPGIRRSLFEKNDQVMRSVIFSYAQKASQDFASIFEGKKVFDNPKSYLDMERLINYLSNPGDLIFDFFSGSGTTGHAVYLTNRGEPAQRRFICVQLPERLDITDKDQAVAAAFCDELGKPPSITEITKERLRRAAKKIKSENPMFAGDLGFRVFQLDSSNIHTWEPDRDHLGQSIFAATEHLKADRSENDILYEVLLKLGLDLCVPMEEKTIVGKTVHSIGGGVLLVCLARAIEVKEIEPLALGIAEWHKSQAPAGDATVVFRDSTFADDVAKTNLTAILAQHGLANVRSL